MIARGPNGNKVGLFAVRKMVYGLSSLIKQFAEDTMCERQNGRIMIWHNIEMFYGRYSPIYIQHLFYW